MNNNAPTIVPFLKWPGGKRWLVNAGHLPTPVHYNRYIEPFLGSGAVYFHLTPMNALIADSNPDLIELYQVVRDSHATLAKHMRTHQRLHCHDYYYQIRSWSPRGRVQRAARLLYLNRTCWNGLYRVNRNGLFNVPKGTKDRVVFDTDNFQHLSGLLRTAEICAQDFETTISHASHGDFLFVDPPYTVKHNLNNFVKYNRHLFSWRDQERLRDSLATAKDRGAMIVVTNANHPAIHNLYSGLAPHVSLDRHSVLSGDASYRRNTSEALFRINF